MFILPSEINQNFLTLIPKIDNANSASHYKPISLCNTSYILITKIICLRIKPMLDNLISPMQSAFLPYRRTSDNIFITYEVLRFMKTTKSKKQFMILKLDLAKVFDMLEWSFIHSVLHFYNFPPLICLIILCITASQLSVLINGRPSKFFFPSPGIRQGDPLPPYIFILCLNYLSLLISNVVDQGNWNPIKLSKSKTSPLIFFHLLFADDILLFSEATISSSYVIVSSLSSFSCFSSLHANSSKSKVSFPNIQTDP